MASYSANEAKWYRRNVERPGHCNYLGIFIIFVFVLFVRFLLIPFFLFIKIVSSQINKINLHQLEAHRVSQSYYDYLFSS